MIEAAVVYVEPQKDGAGDRDRTGDIQLGKLALISQPTRNQALRAGHIGPSGGTVGLY